MLGLVCPESGGIMTGEGVDIADLADWKVRRA